VAELPGGWAAARAGAGVVIGSRAAAWAPCPDLAAVVVIDAHDEGLVQEQAPTWWATEVVRERARRAGVPCLWVTPCPTLELRAEAEVVNPSVGAARRGWAPVEVVDRRTDDPRLGLYSERLVRELRTARRAVCVLNRTGRVRLLACGACGELARCERCGAAVAQGEEDTGTAVRPLVCPRCTARRPPLCLVCHSTRLRHLRIGVSRAREDLERLVGRPVGEITASRADRPDAEVVVGTEAVFHRLASADLVAFLDFDQELLAPRFRAGEEALALLARAARLVGGRRRDGRVLVQARTVEHPALRAAVGADPAILADEESDLRRVLGLPPSRSLAVVTGPGSAELVAGVEPGGPVEVIGPVSERWTLRAGTAAELCDVVAGLERPAERVRIEVDPLRV
jgi:primosomal protein N' (replication factor Y)